MSEFGGEYLSDGGDVVQGHGVQTFVRALQEKLQGREQQGLTKQERAQLLHPLEPQGRLCEWEGKGMHHSPGTILEAGGGCGGGGVGGCVGVCVCVYDYAKDTQRTNLM